MNYIGKKHEKTEIEENVGRVSIEGIGSESNSQALRLGYTIFYFN